jgi:hypothetical protein
MHDNNSVKVRLGEIEVYFIEKELVLDPVIHDDYS